MEFNPKDMIDARVVRANLQPVNDQGAMKCYCTLVVLDGNGREVEIQASVAPWLSYLNSSVMEMSENPEQAYSGFHLLTKAGVSKKDGSPVLYHNLLGLHGIAQPEDWQDQLEAQGMARQYPAGNKKKAILPPGATGADLPGQRTIDDELPPEDEV